MGTYLMLDQGFHPRFRNLKLLANKQVSVRYQQSGDIAPDYNPGFNFGKYLAIQVYFLSGTLGKNSGH